MVAPRTAYHGVIELLLDLDRREQIRLRRTDFTDLDQATPVMDGAALIWVESPTNPMIDVIDLPSLVARAKTTGALVAVDSTLATPLLQQPLSLGADFVVHSATKYSGWSLGSPAGRGRLPGLGSGRVTRSAPPWSGIRSRCT